MSATDPGLDDFAAYAAVRGRTPQSGAPLPRATPLLAGGDLRSVDAVMSGWLATYLEAQLALVTRDETTADAEGNETRAEVSGSLGRAQGRAALSAPQFPDAPSA